MRRVRVRFRRLAAFTSLALSLSLLPLTGAAAAEGPDVKVSSVGGQPVTDDGTVKQPLSGTADVAGTARTGSPQQPAEPGPLHADAGDSPFVTAGDKAPLLGSAYGGTAPYTWAWTSEHGRLTGADSASPAFDTTGLAPGTYDIRLTVTDAAGVGTSDTVKAVVGEETSSELLDETRNDPTPGVFPADQSVEFPFDVPSGVRSLDVTLSWTTPEQDYDLRVTDPSGKVVAQSESAGHPEKTSVADPAEGTWKVVAVKWATLAADVTAQVVARSITADPRPEVKAGGPYKFETGTEQRLSGTITGGTDPVTAAWDLDGDGRFGDGTGTTVTPQLPDGRHLVTLKATDARGLERRETTSVLVGDADRLDAAPPVTVIGIADTGINPYHLEFSARTYPDPDVLALTKNFTRHPSEYIPGYPASAPAIPVTLGKGYLPEEDKDLWTGERVKGGQLHWIPGTKIIGTYSSSVDGAHPVLDDHGHGTGSASVSAGNRYGYCPTCLLVTVEGLDETVATKYPWVDITSHSFGYVGGAPVGPVLSGEEVTKEAAERGQTVLFAAGNGVGNAFDVPVSTWHSDQTGPDWNITVGALRRDDQRAVVGDGIPVHLSSWGIGSLPSACHTGVLCQDQFSGTSAATPYTAGVFGTTLQRVREAIGDGRAGQKSGQVVAEGAALDGSVYLRDGRLTRGELREAVLKNAFPLGEDDLPSASWPLASPHTAGNVLFEGYGAATPETARRAADVLLGRALLPERPVEDDFFAADRAVRDSIWGGYDRDGDGTEDPAPLPSGVSAGLDDVATLDGTLGVLRRTLAAQQTAESQGAYSERAFSYYLHQDPGCGAERTMDRTDRAGDADGCAVGDTLSSAAPYLPTAAHPSTDTLDAPLAAGSKVRAELYVRTRAPAALVGPSVVLLATDREIGRGKATTQLVTGSWTKLTIEFETARHAFTGEQLTVQLLSDTTALLAVGYEGDHATRLTADPAVLPPSGLEFGAGIEAPADGGEVREGETIVAGGRFAFPDAGTDPEGVGGRPETRRVQVSVDDAGFASPLSAELDEATGTWRADAGRLGVGEHVLYARAVRDGTPSQATRTSFRVVPDARVEWQVVSRNAPVDPAAWRPAEGLADWSFRLTTSSYGVGHRTIVVRLVERGTETARDSVRVRFR
ncbi:S8 family serine peptidase [Streptomyces sp. ISL-22]|uniref:S8 family serine peptidase n=1 Tax=unclassified Streptomyces TaxID=2593676 RepID=UPI001BE5FD48|nr:MULTISPECIES: S8 family serine peptidase [unclassified Streptomyces]MBT2420796.1 S8 family serine peptidase [Streptomyces sp. ISL-24]MBT2431886.1 S8 family serine peptidase [Streptomyces sp. ISL-22]